MTTIEFYQYLIHFTVMMTLLMTMAIYLLVSKRNAFGSELVTDQRLRRKAGWMILIYVLIYLANIPLAFWLGDDPQRLQMVSITLDMALAIPMVMRFLLELLQDRKRWDDRLWGLCVLPVVPLTGWLLTGQTWWMWVQYSLYLTEVCTFISWYINGAMEYRQFLLDNYADLEHKEIVWTWAILGSIVLSVVNYLLMLCQTDLHNSAVYSYFIHIADTLFIAICVWYIDHQQVLEPQTEEAVTEKTVAEETVTEKAAAEEVPVSHEHTARNRREDIIITKTGALLRIHCEEPQLYLRSDLSLGFLAKACNTNRTYLSLYFASQGITYYNYINKLRIEHFQSLFREARKRKLPPPRFNSFPLTAASPATTLSPVPSFHAPASASASGWIK